MRGGSHDSAPVSPLRDAHWDAGLERTPGSSFFHGAPWARVLTATYGYHPTYFTNTSAEGQKDLLALMEVNSPLTGRRGIALPFTDECAPLASSQTAFDALFQQALEFGRSRRWKYLECRGGSQYFSGTPASTQFHGHNLTLQKDDTFLWKKIDNACRRAIRKAEQSGVVIEDSTTLDGMTAFYRLLCQTRRRHGVPPQPFAFFHNIQRFVLQGGHGRLLLARCGNEIIAGAIFFHHVGTALYKFGASNVAYQNLRANNLLMWSAIKRYCHEGYHDLDFGRTSLNNEGLRRFKLGWGADERIVSYFRLSPSTGRFETQEDRSSGWHSAIFRRLPLSWSRLIGSVIYKHIA